MSTETADVCLLLEGTYPYVLGGVSAWVDQIIRGLPELKFALYYIGARRDAAQVAHYKLPSNVTALTEIYLQDRLVDAELKPVALPVEMRVALYETLAKFYLAESKSEQAALFWTALDELSDAGKNFTFGNLLHDRESWEMLRAAYEKFAPDESFIDFFWTARFTHLPLWTLWCDLDNVPRARLYHAPSAGYAGWIGSVAARQRRAPFLLTEHGIYTKERIAEISKAGWIYEADRPHISFTGGLGSLKQMWISLFMFLGQIAYDTAARIVTLYEGNAATQVEFGADADAITVIPNGIEPSRFDAIYAAHLKRWQTEPVEKFVGFIGRVVPIKDVKTLLRAARLVIEKLPETQFLIAGPYQEDPNYYDECRKIVELLGIEKRVHFLGMQKIIEILPKMDVLVLTSISEGLPLVVLEGFAAGKPSVATDVGACRELIFGRSPEDRALGRAGRLTKILSPAETANGLLSILTDPGQMRRMSTAGRKRAEQFYSMGSMLGAYRDLYAQLPAQHERRMENLFGRARRGATSSTIN
ncbi:MAG: GT4 family glycosyltransferase PelF [Verrucomicrobia bacterium]|nr:GT4 family glycosyltransferase PelF [Verrucomicrobiota bacterium]